MAAGEEESLGPAPGRRPPLDLHVLDDLRSGSKNPQEVVAAHSVRRPLLRRGLAKGEDQRGVEPARKEQLARASAPGLTVRGVDGSEEGVVPDQVEGLGLEVEGVPLYKPPA